MDLPKIKNLEDLLGLAKDEVILTQKIQPLTAPGENFGSLILRVDVTIKSPKGTRELSTVAKLLPPSDFLQKFFKIQVTFPNEIEFYKTIIPTLQNFQKEQGSDDIIDCFPDYYGSRFNLIDDSTKMDSDGILVLENLAMSDFKTVDRSQGFDLDAVELILKNLASMHAVSLAIKVKNPELFEKNIKAHLAGFKPDEEFTKPIVEKLFQLIFSFDELKPFLPKILTAFGRSDEEHAREPFATICHSDVWVNNIMVHTEDGKPVKIKFVDFQTTKYDSPTFDLFYFFFTSVKNHVVEQHYDRLIKLYHDKFLSTLQGFGCDTAKFDFEEFQKELDLEGKSSIFAKILFMLLPIFAPQGSITAISEVEEDVAQNVEFTNTVLKDKMLFVIKEFDKRNWI